MTALDTIIFDVDGTLVDSRKDIINAVKYALGTLKVHAPPSREIISYIGTGVRDLISKSLGKKHGSLTDEAVGVFSHYYVAHSADESKLYPHVREVLDHFKDKRKLILTNRYRRFADATLKELGIRHYFKQIIGGDDEGCMKPSSCVLDKRIPQEKSERDKTIIVGDMAIDVKAGKNSGIKTCWVTYGLGKKEDLKGLKPDYIIDDIIELKDIIR